jgi:Integrase core domain
MRLGTGSPLSLRDRDGAYGEVFIRRLRSIGICDRPTSPRSSWQNEYAERLIGSIRRECLDHVIVFSERHLRHPLLCYMKYYNGTRTHLSLEKDAPVSRAVDRAGQILCRPILGGLHHQYGRIYDRHNQLFRFENAQNRSLETSGQFAKARHWRAFLRVSRAFSPSVGLPGWSERIRTHAFPIEPGLCVSFLKFGNISIRSNASSALIPQKQSVSPIEAAFRSAHIFPLVFNASGSPPG